jgi:hypothetical protein
MSTAAHYGALAVLHGGDDLTSPMLRELVPNVVTYFCLVRMLGTTVDRVSCAQMKRQALSRRCGDFASSFSKASALPIVWVQRPLAYPAGALVYPIVSENFG